MEIKYLTLGNIPMKIYNAKDAQGAVIAVHGFAGSKESTAIEMLAKRVCEKGSSVISFDLPAHGERTEPFSEMSVQRCIDEIINVEEYAKSTIGGKLYAFATSFGGMCLLNRLEHKPDPYDRIVLRVPAVNMARTLLTISAAFDSSFSIEKAEKYGFRFNMGKEYEIPFRFYDELMKYGCLRSSDKWSGNRLLTIWSGRDELVCPADTERFLELNPTIRSICIENSDHRMTDPENLAYALNNAAEHFCDT